MAMTQKTTPEALTTLPPVAKSIFVFCKKCDADRYQTVLAHTSATGAKIQCEVCKAKSTWKLPKVKISKPAGARNLAGAALKRKTASAAARQNAHSTEYNNLLAATNAEAVPYNMRSKFTVNQKLQHPKFGVGFIRSTQADKIEVVFPDEVRMLVHNRT
jgi:hypothetical protein